MSSGRMSPLPTVTKNPNGTLTLRRVVEIEVPAGGSLYEAESRMQAALQEAGMELTAILLHSVDADGRPLTRDGQRLTAKSVKEPLVVECTFGSVRIERWAYQSSSGGACVYPLDEKMDLIGSATPKLARSIAFKSAHTPAARVAEDLADNHARNVSVHYIQNLSALMGELIIAAQPAPDTGKMPPPEMVATIAVGVDGTCIQVTTENEEAAAAATEASPATPRDKRKHRSLEWHIAMVGTLTLLDNEGERLGSIYLGCAPPECPADGKEEFWFLMEQELAAVKKRYINAEYVGISDGERDFVPWLQRHTGRLILDFWHAAGYLGAAAPAMAAGRGKKARAREWLDEACHALKHEDGAAGRLLAEMKARQAAHGEGTVAGKALHRAVTYYTNNEERMDYAARLREKQPIGSGVTESACGLIIKDRLCGRGMRWSYQMAQNMISLRSLICTMGERWDTLWKSNNTSLNT